VYPHTYLRVNTIFEAARAHGLRTAWSDKHPAYEILNGPSGAGARTCSPRRSTAHPLTCSAASCSSIGSLPVTSLLRSLVDRSYAGPAVLVLLGPLAVGVVLQALFGSAGGDFFHSPWLDGKR